MSDRERLAEVLGDMLAAHDAYHVNEDGWTVCICGHIAVGDDDDGSHARHLADALLTSDALAQMLAEARAETLREVREAEKEIHARGQRADREWCEHRDMYQAGRMEAYYDAVYVLRATLAVAEPDAGERDA